MKALVTRPRDDAASLAEALTARGIEPVLEPLLTIHALPDAAANISAQLSGAQAVLFTSANGARAFAKNCPERNMPVLAVGDATSRAARDAGFSHVESAQGDVRALAALAKARLKPADGALLHPAASDVAGDLAGDLAAAGFTVHRLVIYRAESASRFSPETRRAIESRALSQALFFSPRTAATFVRLARDAGLERSLGDAVAVGLSPAVAAELGGLAWRGVETAAMPDEAGLLAALDRTLKGKSTP